MLCLMSIGPVCLNCAQSCNQHIGSICWLKCIQTTLHWQKRFAHCSLVLGKAFLIPFQSILLYFALTFYVAMSTWQKHEIQLVLLKTDQIPSLFRSITHRSSLHCSLLTGEASLSLLYYQNLFRCFALCPLVQFALTMLSNVTQLLVLNAD
jgi:hypothetical protein